jgi:hypothetical protein
MIILVVVLIFIHSSLGMRGNKYIKYVFIRGHYIKFYVLRKFFFVRLCSSILSLKTVLVNERFTLVSAPFNSMYMLSGPITVAERSMAWTVFAHLNNGIVGSNPTRGMDVYVLLLCVCVVLCVGSGLATGWSPVQWVLPILYRIKKLKNRQGFKGL